MYFRECFIRFPNISNFVKNMYSATRRIFTSFLGVWNSDETLSRMFDILLTSDPVLSCGVRVGSTTKCRIGIKIMAEVILA